MHFNGRFVLNLIQFAGMQGANTKRLIDLSGLTHQELGAEKCILESDIYNTIVESAVTETGDNYFGLHAGENLNVSAAGLIAQIVQTSSTVKEALEYSCQFTNLGCNALPLELIPDKQHYKLTLKPNQLWEFQSPVSVRHTIEGYLAFNIKEYHTLTRNNYYPEEIWLHYDKPENTEELERVFCCPVKFKQHETAMLFKQSRVEEPVVTSDYALLQVLVAHAQHKLNELASSEMFFDVVKRSAINLVKPEFPTIDQVAGHLNLSVRTLQRKLKAEGKSFSEVLDQLKKEFALRYLEQKELNVNQIAYLLNYSDASVFIRSFKRWTGLTPVEYRNDPDAIS